MLPIFLDREENYTIYDLIDKDVALLKGLGTYLQK